MIFGDEFEMEAEIDETLVRPSRERGCLACQ